LLNFDKNYPIVYQITYIGLNTQSFKTHKTILTDKYLATQCNNFLCYLSWWQVLNLVKNIKTIILRFRSLVTKRKAVNLKTVTIVRLKQCCRRMPNRVVPKIRRHITYMYFIRHHLKYFG
jgi:hypothetical protein